MAADKPHPLGLSSEDGKAVARILKEQREADARASMPKDPNPKPENVKEIVNRIVEEGRNPQPAPPQSKKEGRFSFLKRG
jgi:hypothetical protein